ncbi:MAG TPA: glucose-6-phosphate isomerase [bacterium]|nr:MAG: Glucose-6-phosphate isomerase [Parcubacteria group bacterium ADurb.Bin192]HPN14897.1 glucose-6-phosphate isomerase [bacterium]
MSKKLFEYQDEHMRTDLPANARINPQDMRRARQAVIKLHETGQQGWLDILEDEKYWSLVKQKTAGFKKFKHCLVLGIGGSDLGARAILSAVKPKSGAARLWFAGDTTDPDKIEEVFAAIPWKQTCINVISKSGGTLETMSVFFAAKERLEKAVGKNKANKCIICTTDPEEGELLNYAQLMGWATLPIPKNIGGRFSVLTAVGIFPLSLAGVDIKSLLEGAQAMKNDWLASSGPHMTDRFAAWQLAHDKHKKRNIHVMFAYSAKLDSMIHWWRQIWAESLGKARRRDGRSNEFAPTPVASIGPTDQHSQLQLYQEGPNDKIYTFLTVDIFLSKTKVPKTAVKFQPLAYAAGKDFSSIIKAEAQGSMQALIQARRPVSLIKLPIINEFQLGALIVFFEIATAMAGEFYNINAFDQPGVEESKQRAKQLLTG